MSTGESITTLLAKPTCMHFRFSAVKITLMANFFVYAVAPGRVFIDMFHFSAINKH